MVLRAVCRSDASEAGAVFRLLLVASDTCKAAPKHASRAGRSAVDCAVFDAWARAHSLPLWRFIGAPHPSATPTGAKPVPSRSFYTAALNDDVDAMVQSARWGLLFTPCLKVKLDASVARAKAVLSALTVARACARHGMVSTAATAASHLWCVDANTSWTPTVALEFVDLIGSWPASVCDDVELDASMYMVEQPFGVDVLSQPGWKRGVRVVCGPACTP